MSSAPRILGIFAAAALTGGLAACGTPGQGAHPAAASPPRAAASRCGCSRTQLAGRGWFSALTSSTSAWAERLSPGGWPGGTGGACSAWASGKLDIYWPQPGPISGWHPTAYTVTVRLQDIQPYYGQLSYRKMAYIYVNRRGVTRFLQFDVLRPAGRIGPELEPT